jgi:hypothetical protein
MAREKGVPVSPTLWSLSLTLAVAVACGGTGGVPRSVDQASVGRIESMGAGERGVFWLRVPEGARDAVLDRADVEALGGSGDHLLLVADRSEFLKMVAEPEVVSCGYFSTPEAIHKIVAEMRVRLLDDLAAARPEPLPAIVRFDAEPGDAQREALERTGVTVRSIMGPVATIEGPARALLSVAELDFVRRLSAETMTQPLR